MRTLKTTAIVALASFPVLLGVARAGAVEDQARRGLELATMSRDANRGFKGEAAQLEMKIVNARGETINRSMEGKTLETEQDGDKSIITFRSPADVKGTRMLTWTHRKADDDQWLFLPAIKRVKRISSRNKSGSFMGSEFAYEDLASQEVEKYTYRYLGDAVEGKRKVWKLERIPVDKRSGYSKQLVFMDKEYKNAIRIDYFDRKGELLKTGTFTYAKVQRWWRPKTVKVVNHQTRKWSEVAWDNRKLTDEYGDEEFDPDELEE